jgi:hypothetical protein
VKQYPRHLAIMDELEATLRDFVEHTGLDTTLQCGRAMAEMMVKGPEAALQLEDENGNEIVALSMKVVWGLAQFGLTRILEISSLAEEYHNMEWNTPKPENKPDGSDSTPTREE